jgi:hypothetical protein
MSDSKLFEETVERGWVYRRILGPITIVLKILFIFFIVMLPVLVVPEFFGPLLVVVLLVLGYYIRNHPERGFAERRRLFSSPIYGYEKWVTPDAVGYHIIGPDLETEIPTSAIESVEIRDTRDVVGGAHRSLLFANRLQRIKRNPVKGRCQRGPKHKAKGPFFSRPVVALTLEHGEEVLFDTARPEELKSAIERAIASSGPKS